MNVKVMLYDVIYLFATNVALPLTKKLHPTFQNLGLAM